MGIPPHALEQVFDMFAQVRSHETRGAEGLGIGLSLVRTLVQMHGGTFTCSDNWQAFREAVTQSINTGGLHVIEVRTERASNVTMHRQLWKAVDSALSTLW